MSTETNMCCNVLSQFFFKRRYFHVPDKLEQVDTRVELDMKLLSSAVRLNVMDRSQPPPTIALKLSAQCVVLTLYLDAECFEL